jgi:hypothetical protein
MHRFRRRCGRRLVTLVAAAAASLVALAPAAQRADAVILSRTSTRNTAAPSGTNLNSGWQFQGNWGSFTGTPISPRHFITAGHVGGSTGQTFSLNGKTYTTNAMYDDPSTDLRIYRITGTFPSYAPIYTGTYETGKRAMIFGRGTQRGSEVRKSTVLKGWKWGYQDRIKSWGENLVSGYVNGGTGIGQVLKFTFNRQGTSGAQYNEGALSTGDSAGGVFINDGGKWKLAGINYLVDGPFSLSGVNGTGFNASVFDKGGLYQGGDGRWAYNADLAADVPGNFYATRISSRQSWIKSIVGTVATSSTQSGALTATTAVPEPAGLSLLAIGAAAMLRRRRR